MSYQLSDALQAQLELQIKSYGQDPRDFTDQQKMHWILVNAYALEDEINEATAEVGWKPWAISNHINRDAYKGELVDALHFFLNLMLAADISAEELFKGYQLKREKNAKRQADGYDGVSTKCPGCRRALDDDAVECAVDLNNLGYVWCVTQEKFFNPKTGQVFHL